MNSEIARNIYPDSDISSSDREEGRDEKLVLQSIVFDRKNARRRSRRRVSQRIWVGFCFVLFKSGDCNWWVAPKVCHILLLTKEWSITLWNLLENYAKQKSNEWIPTSVPFLTLPCVQNIPIDFVCFASIEKDATPLSAEGRRNWRGRKKELFWISEQSVGRKKTHWSGSDRRCGAAEIAKWNGLSWRVYVSKPFQNRNTRHKHATNPITHFLYRFSY